MHNNPSRLVDTTAPLTPFAVEHIREILREHAHTIRPCARPTHGGAPSPLANQLASLIAEEAKRCPRSTSRIAQTGILRAARAYARRMSNPRSPELTRIASKIFCVMPRRNGVAE